MLYTSYDAWVGSYIAFNEWPAELGRIAGYEVERVRRKLKSNTGPFTWEYDRVKLDPSLRNEDTSYAQMTRLSSSS